LSPSGQERVLWFFLQFCWDSTSASVQPRRNGQVRARPTVAAAPSTMTAIFEGTEQIQQFVIARAISGLRIG
jgi:hypothetical protein